MYKCGIEPSVRSSTSVAASALKQGVAESWESTGDPCRSSRLSRSSSLPHTRGNRPNPVGIPVQQVQAYTAHRSSIAGLCKKNQNISYTNHILQDTTYPRRLKKPSLRWLARIGEGQMRLSSQRTVRAFGIVRLPPPPPIDGCLPIVVSILRKGGAGGTSLSE